MTSASPANILIVDDRPENLTALDAVLEPLGQKVVRATSGEEALRKLLTDNFAVILLDVQMPGIDGFETAAHIKQREKSRHIPIIFLTAISKEPHHTLRGYTVGAVDYVFKPFDPDVLRSKVSVFVELYQLRREAEMLAHRALHDPLTGLPNRVLVSDRIELALAALKRRDWNVAVLFLDVDRFKQINDNLGHAIGDEVLVEIANRLRDVVRASDTVARFGGDEFVILADGLKQPRCAVDLAERIADVLAEPVIVEGGHEVSSHVSIGIAVTNDPEHGAEILIREADSAMYDAKRGGNERYVVFRRAAEQPGSL